MKPGLVLDASVALAWCFSDEATPAAWNVLQRLDGEPATAPALLPLELANVLALAERSLPSPAREPVDRTLSGPAPETAGRSGRLKSGDGPYGDGS